MYFLIFSISLKTFLTKDVFCHVRRLSKLERIGDNLLHIEIIQTLNFEALGNVLVRSESNYKCTKFH